ncbi:MAG: 23S rRNA (pseudouridine(1915)-N(3))-methyltransferase RlmH [Bacteroidota bacterium]
MNIVLIAIGKTDNHALQELIDSYAGRLRHYVNFELEIIPDIKNNKHFSKTRQKKIEGENLLKKLRPTDMLVLFDEHGKHYTSPEFASYLQGKMNSGIKRLALAIGGPYGFSPEVFARAQGKISLSKMTFSHQMVRLFVVEQIYRGFSILRNEPYHHR